MISPTFGGRDSRRLREVRRARVKRRWIGMRSFALINPTERNTAPPAISPLHSLLPHSTAFLQLFACRQSPLAVISLLQGPEVLFFSAFVHGKAQLTSIPSGLTLGQSVVTSGRRNYLTTRLNASRNFPSSNSIVI